MSMDAKTLVLDVLRSLGQREAAELRQGAAEMDGTAIIASKNPLGIPGFGSSLDCNRVYKDYPAIVQAAGLNGFTAPDPDPAPDMSTCKQLLTIGPITNGDAFNLMALCESLGLTKQGLYRSDWADADKLTQTLTIGPVSSGDAWYIMRRCDQLGLCAQELYHSKYV